MPKNIMNLNNNKKKKNPNPKKDLKNIGDEK